MTPEELKQRSDRVKAVSDDILERVEGTGLTAAEIVAVAAQFLAKSAAKHRVLLDLILPAVDLVYRMHLMKLSLDTEIEGQESKTPDGKSN